MVTDRTDTDRKHEDEMLIGAASVRAYPLFVSQQELKLLTQKRGVSKILPSLLSLPIPFPLPFRLSSLLFCWQFSCYGAPRRSLVHLFYFKVKIMHFMYKI